MQPRNETSVIEEAIAYNTKILNQRLGVEPDIDNPNRTYTSLPCKRDFEVENWSNWTIEPNLRCAIRGNGTLNVLVMGNSISYFAFNQMHKIFNGRYNTLRLFSKSVHPGVYSSPKSPISVEFEKSMEKVVESMKPDVIFVMYTAHYFGEGIHDLRAPIVNLNNDTVLQHLQRNFQFYSKHTKRIVIDLPYHIKSMALLQTVVNRLKLGQPLDDLKITRKDLYEQQHWHHERLRNLNCSICLLNDVNEMSVMRLDLQGLRGVAILLVLIFHLKPKLVPLGFIGVDMFFILSGYLMTMILSKKHTSCAVILDFYSRRFKRIVPLFGCILTMVYIVSWLLLLTVDRLQLLTDLLWSLTFTSNMQPLFETKGYWAQISSYRFLVHCWSLGVEIQFYIIAPFIVGYCSEKKWNFVVYILFFSSLMFQLIAPVKMAYGLLLSRIWQFLCGTIAYEIEYSHSSSQLYYSLPIENEKLLAESTNDISDAKSDSSSIYTILRELLIVFVVLLVFLNLSLLDETRMRLIVVLLTSVYICTGHTASYTLLSSKVLVYIGDISYTLYLLHWPIIVLYKYCYSLEDLDIAGICWCLLIMFLLTIIIHHTLEKLLLRSSLAFGFITFVCCLLFLVISSPMYKNDVQFDFFKMELRNETSVIEEAIAYNTKILNQKLAVEPDIDNPNRTYACLPCKRDFEVEKWSNWTIEPNLRCAAHGNGTLNVLVMGNSISYYTFHQIHKIFNGRYNTLRLFSKSIHPGIYSSPRSPISVEFENSMKKVVESMKPDVIFVMYTAHYFGEGIHELRAPIVNINNDTTLQHLQRNFQFYSKHTKRIVIDLPYHTKSMAHMELLKIVINRLRLGQPLDDLKITRKDLYDQQHWHHERLRNLNCSICLLNDVNEALFTGDTHYLYDRKTFQAYYYEAIHLTYAGVDLLKGLYTNIIERVITELS